MMASLCQKATAKLGEREHEVFPHPLVPTSAGQSTLNAFEEGQLYWWVARKDSVCSDLMF